MRSFTILLLTLCFHYAYGQRHMVVSKQNYSLAVVENEDTLFKCPVAVGKAYGDKTRRGDMKTPEVLLKSFPSKNPPNGNMILKMGKV